MAKASVKQRAAKRPVKATGPAKPASKPARPIARAVAKPAAPTRPARPSAATKSAGKAAAKPSAKAAARPAPRVAARPAAKAAARRPEPAKPAKSVAAAKPTAAAVKPAAVATKAAAPAKPVAPAKAAVATKSAEPAKPAAVNGAASPAPAEAAKPSGFRLSQGPFVGTALTKKGTFAPNKLVVPPPKLKRVDRAPVAVVPPPPPPPPAVATSEKAQKNRAGLNQKDLDFFRDLLLAKRRELLGDMSSMEREALREGNSDLSTLPIHMADQGTDAYEQEFTLGLVEKDRTLLREINNALAKIQNGTYGICEGTGLPISKPRLEAQPWAKYSIEHARVLEKRQMTFRRA